MFVVTTLRRKATVAFLVGTFALSGGPLIASPAYAADDTLRVISPAADEVLGSRTVEVTGSGTPGGLIEVAIGTDQPRPGIIEVDAGGTWETEIVYPDDYFAPQSITVTQTVAGESAGQVERRFMLPDPDLLFVDTPSAGSAVGSRYPELTGRAPEDTNISATVAGESVGGASASAGGVFSLQLFLPAGEAGSVDVVVTGTYYSMELQPKTLSIVLPASLPAPVVATPVDTTVIGTSVTIAGTASPDDLVIVNLGQVDGRTGAATADATGRWSLSIDLPTGDYTGTAFIADTVTDLGLDGALPGSYTTEFAFSVQAPTAAAPAGTPAAPVKAAPHQLAATGSSADVLLGGGALLVGLGTALMLSKRRRVPHTPRI